MGKDQKFFYHNEVVRIESGGKSLSFCTDPRLLEEQMLALSPADAKLTKEFIRLLTGRDMSGAMSLKPPEMAGSLDSLKRLAAVLPLMGTFRKYGKLTIQEFTQRFQDPFLRDAGQYPVFRTRPFPADNSSSCYASSMASPSWPLCRECRGALTYSLDHTPAY